MSEIAQAPHSSPDGKIPQLRFPEFNDNWEEQKVGSFMVERNKKSPKSEAFPLMSFVARKGVTEKGKRYNREFLVNDEGGKKYKQTEYGDFIYSSNNLETGSIGLNKYGAATISPVYSIFQITDTCNYEFVSSSLVTKIFIHKMVRFRQGVVYGQWRIHESDFLKIQVELPSLEEQTKIASFLSSIDSKIEQLSKKQALLGEYKKGLMEQIFSQAIRFKANDGSDFPDWEEKKLGDLSVVISDGNYGELYPTSSDFKLTGVPFLRANNIKSLKIDGTDTKYITEEQHSLLTSGHLQTNDILITTRGVLGNLAIVESTHNGSNINAQICLLRVTNTSELNHFYLLFVLDHRDSKKQYKAFETGTALKQLPKGNLRKIKLKLPTLFEQNKIANFLSSIDTKIEQVDKQLDESKQFKKALLQQMFV